jgi:hypothetical protein
MVCNFVWAYRTIPAAFFPVIEVLVYTEVIAIFPSCNFDGSSVHTLGILTNGFRCVCMRVGIRVQFMCMHACLH